nr:MAG TPA: hypothetical protein [Caudoviricetes sp.]
MRRCGQRLVERRSGGTEYHYETGGRSSGLTDLYASSNRSLTR